MSRLGKKIVPVPNGVTVTINPTSVEVKGPKATLSMKLPGVVTVELTPEGVQVTRPDDTRKAKSFHGLTRTLIANMVEGVTQGFKKDLTIVGIGYRAAVSGNKLTMNLGFSHPVEYIIPEGVKVTVIDNTKIAIEGSDKQAVGEAAATIRRSRPPEPYKGKGIRYVDEKVRQKEGKTVG